MGPNQTQQAFCTAKETIDKTERWPNEIEIFANEKTDKGLIYLIYI